MSRTKHHRQSTRDRGLGTYKKIYRRKRKAKEKQAMRNEKYDNVPTFKKSDKYDYY